MTAATSGTAATFTRTLGLDFSSPAIQAMTMQQRMDLWTEARFAAMARETEAQRAYRAAAWQRAWRSILAAVVERLAALPPLETEADVRSTPNAAAGEGQGDNGDDEADTTPLPAPRPAALAQLAAARSLIYGPTL